MKLIIVAHSLSLIEDIVEEVVVKHKHSIINIYRTGKEYIAASDLMKADAILLDCHLPDSNGLKVAQKSIWKFPHLRIIGLTEKYINISLSELIESGVKACVLHKNFSTQLITAIETISRGKLYFPSEISIDSM